MIGLVAGVAGWWMTVGLEGPATVLLAGLTALIVAAYVHASRHDIDGTTEVAAMVAVVCGALAGQGYAALASGITAGTVLWLAEKSRLHDLVGRIGSVELVAGARFAVMAAVVLPLLPADSAASLGPFGDLRLRQLWALVLFFSGLSFLGYMARRALGSERGFAIAGAIGGLASSTSVTLTFSRLSRSHEETGLALAAGVMGANVMLFPRVLLACSVLAPTLAAAIWPVFIAPVAIGILMLARGVSQQETPAAAPDDNNPLQLGAALQMAMVFQIVLSVVAAADHWFGAAGVFGSAAVMGLTDVDALTISMAQRVEFDTPAVLAAAALTLGILSNTIVKAGLAMVIGRGRFRRLAASGLFAMAVALALGAWVTFY
jgi:uncharacterized membrane protein (DUF4010 family)